MKLVAGKTYRVRVFERDEPELLRYVRVLPSMSGKVGNLEFESLDGKDSTAIPAWMWNEAVEAGRVEVVS